jgi:hypothetical protein
MKDAGVVLVEVCGAGAGAGVRERSLKRTIFLILFLRLI